MTQIEVRLAILFLHQRRRVGPAKPQVQGHVAQDLEVILSEDRDPILQVRPRVVGVAAAPALARHHVEQEVGERETS